MLTFSKSRSGSNTQFPGKLHEMMNFVEENALESIISWELNGHGIKVNNPDRLVDILPLFFGQTKYRSFRRQLNMWHFHRILEGPKKGTFVHPYFVRHDRDLCTQMSRQISFKPSAQKEQEYIAMTMASSCIEPNPIATSHKLSNELKAQNEHEEFMAMASLLEPDPIFEPLSTHDKKQSTLDVTTKSIDDIDIGAYFQNSNTMRSSCNKLLPKLSPLPFQTFSLDETLKTVDGFLGFQDVNNGSSDDNDSSFLSSNIAWDRCFDDDDFGFF